MSKNQVVEAEGWYAFELDGTLATYNSQQWPEIGEPIQPMVDLVKQYLKRGLQVRIMTARAGDWSQRQAIKLWCLAHIGKVLPITNAKDYQMLLLYDDRAIQVEKNTGRIIEDESKELDETMSERDLAEEAMSKAYTLVTGFPPEWPNVFGYKEALDQIEEELALLRNRE